VRLRCPSPCTLVFTLAAACADATAGIHAAASDGTVTLSITGREGVRVHGWCLLRTSEGERRLDLDEAVPVERRWRANGLRCELEAQGGPVTVEAMQGGSRSRISTSGGRIKLSLG
jgi:hypothetical protein